LKEVKVEIAKALKASSTLVALTNGAIYSGWPPLPIVPPPAVVGFYRVWGKRGVADGMMSQRIEELYSIDIFAKTMIETENAEIAIDAAMNTLPYIVMAEHGPDFFEQDTKIFHKVLRYVIKS